VYIDSMRSRRERHTANELDKEWNPCAMQYARKKYQCIAAVIVAMALLPSGEIAAQSNQPWLIGIVEPLSGPLASGRQSPRQSQQDVG